MQRETAAIKRRCKPPVRAVFLRGSPISHTKQKTGARLLQKIKKDLHLGGTYAILLLEDADLHVRMPG